jgi:hypothetical protein
MYDHFTTLMLKQIFFFLLMLLLTNSVHASGIARFSGLDNGSPYTLSLEYLNRATSRIDMDDSSDVESYLLFKNRQGQVVTRYQGNTLVMDLANMNRMAQSLGIMNVLGIDSETLMINVVSMKATGKKEKVSGIEGEVYKLTWIRDNIQYQDELVVTSDSKAWEYTEAWIDVVENISRSSPSININGGELLTRVSNDKLGILRIGNRFRLVSVHNKTVSPERFIAPDTSFEIPGLGDLLGNL